MKRYNIKCDPGPLPAKGDRRIVIKEAENGEWVRYEDAGDCKFQCRAKRQQEQFQTVTKQLPGGRYSFRSDMGSWFHATPDELVEMLKQIGEFESAK